MLRHPSYFYLFRGLPPPPSVGLAQLFDDVFFHWDDAYVEMAEWANDAFHQTEASFKSVQSFPPFNATQKVDGSLFLEFAFAGYEKKDIEITFEGDRLTLSSKGIAKEPEDGDRAIKHGIKTGKFSVSYNLPSERYEVRKTVAKFLNGMLYLTLPLAEAKKPSKVDIE